MADNTSLNDNAGKQEVNNSSNIKDKNPNDSLLVENISGVAGKTAGRMVSSTSMPSNAQAPTGNEAIDSLDNDAITDKAKELGNAGKKAVQDKGKKEVKNATKKLIKGKGFKIPKIAGLGKIILIIIAILWICGLILALVYAPSMLGGGIVASIEKIFKAINTKVSGASGKVNEKDVMSLADYARSKGFQLYADGFILEKYTPADLESDTYNYETGESDSIDNYKYIEEEGIMLDKEGQHVVRMKTKDSVLERYALMNAYTYTAEHEQNQIIKGIRDLLGIGKGSNSNYLGNGEASSGANDFTGMIRFEYSPWDANDSSDQQLKGQDVVDKIFKEGADTPSGNFLNPRTFKIDMEKKTLRIKTGYWSNPYVFDINGWAGRYGMPTEFLLALHKSVMAPDLIYELTNGTRVENDKYIKTKMLVRLIKAKGNVEGGFKVPDDTTINGKLYDSSHNEVTQDDVDFEAIRLGEQILYARAGTPEDPIYFPLKTTEGEVNLKLPTTAGENGADQKTIIPNPNDEYDITEMYISFDGENSKFRKINGYIVNMKEVKEYLKDSNASGMGQLAQETDRAYAFALNFGLHNFVRRYNEKYDRRNLKAFAEDIKDAVEKITDGKYESYLPLIYKVQDHWFRDVYFYMNEGQKYALIDEDEFIKKGEYWTKFKEKNSAKEKEVDYETVDKKWSAYEVESVPIEKRRLNFKTYVVDEDDPDTPESIKRLQALGEVIQIKEDFNIKVKQTEDGRRGETNARTKRLFADESWYIYDGTEKTATNINKRRAERGADHSSPDTLKRKLTKDMDLLAGSLMLENMESLDAEYAYRDYKELLLELDYYTVDDLSQRIRRVLTWPVPGVSVGGTWPDTKGVKDENDFGVKILDEKSTEKLIEESLKDESGNPLEGEDKKKALAKAKSTYGEGFKPDVNVVSPVTGKVVKQDENSIEIIALNNEDNVDAYKEFFEDEYKGGVAGYKIIIKNINVGIEDKSLYKPQISEKEIERLSTEEQRKKVKEREDNKKEAPAKIGEYIKEGTIIGKTTDKEIVIYMNSIDDEIVEHVDKYLLVPYSNLRIELLEDYLTKIIDGEPNQIESGDVEAFKKMFPQETFPVLYENAEAFLEMQEMYEVNAIFAAAVSISESSGGTNWGAIPKEYNNIFSITGSSSSEKVHHYDVGPSRPGSTNPRTWRKYKTVRDSILDFGKLIHDGYHSENRDYVSEVGYKYVGTEDGNTEAEHWIKTTNGQITAALERYLNSSETAEENQQDSNNKDNNEGNQSDGGAPDISTSVTTYETNPFDLLNLRGERTKTNFGGYSSGSYENSVYQGEVEFINGFYYFNQADKKWKNTTYGGYSISGSACGPFSVAMALSAVLGRPIDPIEIVRLGEAAGSVMPGGGSYWNLFPAAAQKYNVPFTEINQSQIDSKLEEGCVLIVSHGPGYWSNSGHFIVVVKKNSDGTYAVNDPGYRNKSINHDRTRTFGTAKNIWAVGPSDAVKSLREGRIPDGGNSSGGGSGSNTTARQAFEKLAREKNITEQEKRNWEYIINRESSWNYKARNKSSGAYGLPQALPGNKMAEFGSDWKTNPETQLRWMYNYMKQRYGGINQARAFWDKKKWY